MPQRKHAFCFRVALSLFGLLLGPSLLAAQNTAWGTLKQLTPGQQVQVVLSDKKSYKGEFQSVSDEVIIIHAKGGDQTHSRQNIQRVSSRRPGHRGRHALIGAAIGASAGLGTGAAIDNDCSPQSIVCTGNKGKAILTPVFGLIGAGIGALLPSGGWQEVYRSN